MRDEALGRCVVLVDPDMRLTQGENPQRLAGRDSYLDREAAARLELRGNALETSNLRVLRGQVVDRVEDEVHKRKRLADARHREVADRDRDLLAAWLRAELGDHVWRKIDAVHARSARGERERDAPRTNAQLEGCTFTGELNEEVDGRSDYLGISPVAERRVVPLRDLAREVVHCLPRPLQLPVALRMALADAEDPESGRDRDEANHDQRPDVPPDGADAVAVQDRVADPPERVGRRRDRRQPLHPLRQHADGVIDA